jgi:hypothetical protein
MSCNWNPTDCILILFVCKLKFPLFNRPKTIYESEYGNTRSHKIICTVIIYSSNKRGCWADVLWSVEGPNVTYGTRTFRRDLLTHWMIINNNWEDNSSRRRKQSELLWLCFIPLCPKSKCTDVIFKCILDSPEFTSHLLRSTTVGKLHSGSNVPSFHHSRTGSLWVLLARRSQFFVYFPQFQNDDLLSSMST